MHSGRVVADRLTKTFDPSGRVVEYSRGIIRTDRYALVPASDSAADSAAR
jgi:DNA-binding GntR family transcriptional regulator